ncbi:hypothetical protein NQ317_007210 [Molorchus minor]|uniref:Laminin G domain-containing protein n=1 Tax=Molorchus minor TaxID=1323400 RepID=A0ABQ9JSU2_9CUCU|nr:hypothetical protein NQ317_007210 [Molorchus minor]
MVALTSDFQLTFKFTLNTGVSKELVIVSGRKLNGGEWHKVWIDYNKYHVRFMINEDSQMVNLKPEEEFGPFEGSMFIGGAISDLLEPKSSVYQGLIGCFRGLVVNEEILDIYSYMSVHLSEIIKEYINTNGITFTHPESFLRRNYLINDTSSEKDIMRKMFHERILVNLRTYENVALIFYANDNLNNFVHLYIDNGTQVVYLFNYDNEIHNVTVDYLELNTSKSIQIAIERDENNTTVHVNDQNNTIPIGLKLLTEYSNKPWINPEKEVLAPQRPPAPPTEYFQLNLGGFDPETLLKVSESPPELPGYVGCLRGLQIGYTLVDLPSKVNESDKGVIPHCNMKCDEVPCKHEGICIEDFRNQEHTCDCEHTSYYGEFCSEEKGAEFNGESILWREYVLNGSVDHVKFQLAFSTDDVRQKNTILLLLQTKNHRSYYLLVGLSLEGYLTVQEDREGEVYSATLNKKNFINGARHSVYYNRDFNDSELYIDRELTPMDQIPAQTFINIPEPGANEVHIGGHDTNDPRFAIYKRYSGCLSNIFIEVNEHVMKPLEEYMLFTSTGTEKVNVSNQHGVRSAQCSSDFDVVHEKTPLTTSLNISQGTDKTWVQDAPQRVLYTSIYSTTTEEEDAKEQFVIMVLAAFFLLVVICCSYHIYITNKKYKERKEYETDAIILLSKQQAALLQENTKPPSENDDAKPITQNGKLPNENTSSSTANGKTNHKPEPIVEHAVVEDVPVPEEVPIKPLKRADSKREKQKRISFRGDIRISVDSASELAWDPPEETNDLLSPMIEEEEECEEESEEMDQKSVSSNGPLDNLERMAPISSISEVTLFNPDRKSTLYNGGNISPGDNEDADPVATGSRKSTATVNGQINSKPESAEVTPLTQEDQQVTSSSLLVGDKESDENPPEHIDDPKFLTNLKPVFLNEHQRKFANPVYYLGGPRLPERNRWSVESVLSLD